MRIMANYFDHLLSFDMPTYTVAHIAKRFEPSAVLWAFHTIQPFSTDIVQTSATLALHLHTDGKQVTSCCNEYFHITLSLGDTTHVDMLYEIRLYIGLHGVYI